MRGEPAPVGAPVPLTPVVRVAAVSHTLAAVGAGQRQGRPLMEHRQTLVTMAPGGVAHLQPVLTRNQSSGGRDCHHRLGLNHRHEILSQRKTEPDSEPGKTDLFAVPTALMCYTAHK